jgi:uncharacterized protein YfdQ (DUF2303 family)
MIDRSAIQELASFTVAGLEARRVSDFGAPYTVVPPDWSLHDLEALLPAPARARGQTELGDCESFCAWVNERKGERTRIYATNNPTQGVRFVAVLDDTTSGEQPSWADWRGVYAPMVTPEWQIWTAMNGKRGAQRDFAEFVESNVDDVFSGSPTEPPGAVLLELAQVLHATIKAEFSSATRLTNGATQLRYAETINATGGNGALEMPEQFFLGIPVFMGGPTYKIGARLRYRIDPHSHTLQIGFDLVRAHKVIEQAAADIIERITEKTALPLFMGVPQRVQRSGDMPALG